jgi:MHS family citrate/tricarballylate:H+ symporter-like MFS transporter
VQKSVETKLSGMQLGAIAAGNGLEFYDFLSFSIFATQIAKAFFPSRDASTGLLLTLAVFGIGFLARPLGGFLMGRMADVYGRRPAMLWSFALMGIAMAGIALTPTYAAIGVAAPICVVFFRLLQGFAVGGEVGPSSAFLLESAPVARRGLYMSFQFSSQQAAILLAGMVGLGLTELMGADALSLWGWRLAFLLGSLITPFGLVMRSRLPETLVPNGEPVAGKGQLGLVLLGLVVFGGATIATYTLSYMTIFARHTLGLTEVTAFTITAVSGVCGTVFMVIGGIVSDHFGRKPTMTVGMSMLMITAPICFVLIIALRLPLLLYICVGLMASLLGILTPSAMLAVAENLPSSLRAGSIGTIYAIAISLFGGTAQFAVAWLTSFTGSPLAPALYMTLALFLALLASLPIRETVPSWERLVV